jgi:hypothetical protein
VCVLELGDGARLLCVFVVLFKFIYRIVDFSGVNGSCVPRLFGWAVVGIVVGCSRVFPCGRNGRAMPPVVLLF